MIRIKRVYEPRTLSDGTGFLVERLWPRGMKKESLNIVGGWLKDAAPSAALRLWFGHEPARWPIFKKRYRAELDAHPQAWQPILDAARKGDVTLYYSARDTKHNSALILKQHLETMLARRGRGRL